MSKFFDPGRVRSIFCGSCRVVSGQSSMVLVWKITLKNVKFFNFFPWGQKNLFGLGQKVPGSKDGLLFTVGQK